jgi:polysaccharide biosynthesis PFTS motif protein
MTQPNKQLVIDAYKSLYDNNRLYIIYDILNNLQKTFVFNRSYKYNYIYKHTAPNLNLIFNQYLYAELITRDFNSQLLLSVCYSKKITHPLPRKWRKLLINNSCPVNIPASAFNYFLYSLNKYLKNIYSIFSSYYHHIYKNHCKEFPENYIEFCDIPLLALPINNNEWNIIDWAIKYYNNYKFNKIYHNVEYPDIFYKNYIISSKSYFIKKKSKSTIFYWIIISIIYAFYKFLKGEFAHSILIFESFKNKTYDCIPKHNLAKEYLFSLSIHLYRPMWTYTAEKNGSQITLYGYASSFGGYNSKNNNENLEFEYENLNWPKILLWSNDYINFIKSKVPNNVIVEKVKFPIYLTDKYIVFPKVQKKFITIFDVTPSEEFYSCNSLVNMNYRNFESSKLFLLDLYKISEIFNYSIVWKRKRKFGYVHSREYIEFCKIFELRDNIYIIDSEASAFRIINESEIVISIPFTSTAFIAKDFGKKSIFYDPTKLLSKQDRGRQEIDLISGYDELYNWFKIINL